MTVRSRRTQQFLDEMLPEARTLMSGNRKASIQSPDRLLDALKTLLMEEDRELFLALLGALREQGLTEVWEFLWEVALSQACEKSYTNDYHSALVGLPLFSAWNGRCTGADRREIIKALRDHNALSKNAKLTWFAVPQTLHDLYDTDPITLWELNTPDSPAPYLWTYRKSFSPGPHVLVGRLDLPPGAVFAWPDLEALRQTMVARLGWSPKSLGFLALLPRLLERDPEEADPEEETLMKFGLVVRQSLQKWLAEQGERTEGCCRLLLESPSAGSLEVYVHAKGRQKTCLCRVEYDSSLLDRERILDRLRLLLADLEVSILWSLSSGREGEGTAETLH